MKYCTQCGKAMDEAYSNCPYCGIKFQAEPENNAQEAKEQTTDTTNNYGAPVYSNTYAPQQPPQPQQENIPEYIPAPAPQRSAYVAAFLALFFGMFGLHDFYLDRKNKGFIKLIVTLLGFGIGAFVMQILSVIDALKLLKGEINVDGRGEMIRHGF